MNSGATLNLEFLTLADGSVTIAASGSVGKGGAINNQGTLAVTNSTFSDDQATGGAGSEGGVGEDMATLTLARAW